MNWYVAYCTSRTERQAEKALQALGVDAYCPTVTVWATHARKRERVQRPLFPRYMFACLANEQRHLIRDVREIHSLVSNAGMAVPVQARVIEKFRTLEARGLFDETQEPEPIKFVPGEPVKVIMGPFEGFVGEVLQARRNGRSVAVLLDGMLGAQRELIIDAVELEKREEAA